MIDIKETIQGLYSLKTYLASQAIEEHGPARESLIGMQKVVDSAVNLLKEQNNCENCAIAIEDRQSIVRCKDCYFGEHTINGAGERCVQCTNSDLGMMGDCHMPNWFCADGERRDDDG